jgi:hypothetical protein
MDQQAQRLDTIDEELELGFDQSFENTWRKLELTTHALLLLFVIAALGGAFGRGPLDHRSQANSDGTLSIDYEPVVRYGTTTQITVHVAGSEQGNSEIARPAARLFISNTLIEPLGLQQVIPQPNETTASSAGAIYRFEVPPNKAGALVRMVIKPSSVGPVQAKIGNEDGESVSFTQLALPGASSFEPRSATSSCCSRSG